ncbi:MAG: LiaI-LiaF-like domain-containing protein [Actinomycetota bacterium]
MSLARVLGGVALVAVGAALLLDATGLVALSAVAATWWPLVLVAAGVAFAAQASGGPEPSNAASGVGAAETGLAPATTPDGPAPTRAVSGAATAVLGRRHLTAEAGPYPGGAVTVLLGGLELDLTRVTLPPGGAVLDVTAILGEVSVTIPEGWRVRREGAVLAADVEQPAADDHGGRQPELVLCGAALLADVDVRSRPPSG